MQMLNCDICGTIYPDTEANCPNCGYARAFAVPEDGVEMPHNAPEKVPGGRFSKKNVKKRLDQKTELEQQELPAEEEPEPVPAPEPETQPEAEPEDENKKKLLAVYRRDVTLNLALFFSLVVLAVSLFYLAVNWGIPWLKAQNWIPAEPSAVVTGEPAIRDRELTGLTGYGF